MDSHDHLQWLYVHKSLTILYCFLKNNHLKWFLTGAYREGWQLQVFTNRKLFAASKVYPLEYQDGLLFPALGCCTQTTETSLMWTNEEQINMLRNKWLDSLQTRSLVFPENSIYFWSERVHVSAVPIFSNGQHPEKRWTSSGSRKSPVVTHVCLSPSLGIQLGPSAGYLGSQQQIEILVPGTCGQTGRVPLLRQVLVEDQESSPPTAKATSGLGYMFHGCLV